jgi:hypothetical protein
MHEGVLWPVLCTASIQWSDEVHALPLGDTAGLGVVRSGSPFGWDVLDVEMPRARDGTVPLAEGSRSRGGAPRVPECPKRPQECEGDW